jgi:hypothetical protein
VLYAITKLNSVDVHSLCSCTVCGPMLLLSVVCVPGVAVLVRSGHRISVLKCIKLCMGWNKRNNLKFPSYAYPKECGFILSAKGPNIRVDQWNCCL